MHTPTDHTFLPIAINITGRRILIIGGGRVGLHKATILSRCTHEAEVISPTFREGFEHLPFRLVRKAWEPADLEGAFLVYVCTEDEALNREIKAEAARRGILTSVCDNPDLCDFTSPAILTDGPLRVAVTTNAQDVRRAIRVRDRLKALAEEDPEILK